MHRVQQRIIKKEAVRKTNGTKTNHPVIVYHVPMVIMIFLIRGGNCNQAVGIGRFRRVQPGPGERAVRHSYCSRRIIIKYARNCDNHRYCDRRQLIFIPTKRPDVRTHARTYVARDELVGGG